MISNKRCLIVLDDVWKEEPLLLLKKLLTDVNGEVLVTTMLAKVVRFGEHDVSHKMRLLNTEESWCLIRQKVFKDELCPPELEKVGKKIAENCKGLPLAIVTIANHLCEAEKTLMYWNKVAERKNSVFTDAYNEMSKVLLPSYKSLQQHLKPCFLYIGVFAQKYEIPPSKLFNMWIAEGLVETNPMGRVEAFTAECLLELVDRSLGLVYRRSSNKIKTCCLHSVFWHLSNSEAVKNKFFHALNSYADNIIEGTTSQRRLCIRNNILLGIKDARNSIASLSSTHSLLCTGPPHQYFVPIFFSSKMLRVLDAVTIQF